MGETHRGEEQDPEALRVALAGALAERHAARALELAERLPTPERHAALARVWHLVGSARELALALAAIADPAERVRLEADLAPWPLDLAALDDYEPLLARAASLGERGLARELALTQLALAEVAPRVDWRAVHVQHAVSLAETLGDPRLTALVVAFEARLDAGFGELDDAIERAHEATRLAEEADAPLALALAELTLAHAASDEDLAARARARAVAHGLDLPEGAWGLEPKARPAPDGA